MKILKRLAGYLPYGALFCALFFSPTFFLFGWKNGLFQVVLSSLPSLYYFYSKEPLWIWAIIALGLPFVSRLLYVTLVYYTGARPAEYYSVQKRPEYAEYQKTTNMFFPGPPKSGD